jgi:hypothetical protein
VRTIESTVDSIGAEMRRVWGNEGLRSCPAPALRDVNLSGTSLRFLITYGLPTFYGWHFLADVGDTLPGPDTSHPSYRILGVSSAREAHKNVVCLDAPSGRVIHFQYSVLVPKVTILNSSIEQFAAFLVLHRQLLEESAGIYEAIDAAHPSPCMSLTNEEFRDYGAQVDGVLRRIRHEMHLLDPHVMEDVEEHYWPAWLAEYDDYGRWDIGVTVENWFEEPS